jgi:hypothetical protein
MAAKQIVVADFTGGIGTIGEKRDVEGSAKYVQGLNVYEDSSYVVNSKKATKVSLTTITGLPQWLIDGSPWTQNRFVYDKNGVIYVVNPSDTVSVFFSVSSSAGQGIGVFEDYLYYANGTTIGRYGPLSLSTTTYDPALNAPAFLETVTPVVPGTFNFDSDTGSSAYGGGTGSTYTTPLAISETATNRQTFTPTFDPIRAIQLNIVSKGTGNWTVTVDDVANHHVASVTVTNANLTNGRYLFVFSPHVRIIRNNQYHFHVTSTVADGTVNITSGSTNGLEDAEYATYFGILIPAQFHQMVVVEDKLIFGNERYLGVWDEASYNPNTITFDSGMETRTLAKFEEYVVAGTYRGDNPQEAEESRLFTWDAVTAGFNTYVDTTLGIPLALHNTRNNLVGVYSNNASVYTGADPFKKVVDNIPFMQRGKYIEVYPGAITEYDGRTLIGYAADTSDTGGFTRGVYEFGSQVDETADSFNLPYIISTGNTGSTVKIGMVRGIGKDLYIGWQDGSSYGLDRITIDSTFAPYSTWQSLIFDNEKPDKEKLPQELIVNFEPLTTGQSVTTYYKVDRGSWVLGQVANTVGDRRVETAIFNRFKELEMRFDLASSSNTILKVYAVTLNFNDLEEERSSA